MDNNSSSFFTKSNIGLLSQLTNEAIVMNGSYSESVIALWDTGASGTTISEEIAKKLNLIPTGKQVVHTPAGIKEVNTYLVDIILPNHVRIQDIKVCGSEIHTQGLGVLIGMDIIGLGDFSVSNYRGITSFTFRIPSQKETNYVQEIRINNLVGPKHGKGKRKKK